MAFRRFDESFSGLTPADDHMHHIMPEEQKTQTGCTHGIEFWVAVRTVERDGDPVIIQWCMRCRQVETLSLEAYEHRKRLRSQPACDDAPEWWEKE